MDIYSHKNAAGILSAFLAAVLIMLCGCSGNIESNAENNKGDGSEFGNQLIERNKNSAPSAAEGSISFEDACSILDEFSGKELYLPQDTKDYKKYYFGTIDYMGDKYYSVYPYIEVAGKKIFMGTNCLVSCDGQTVLKKSLTGDYAQVSKSSSEDITVQEKYAEAKTAPNEAVAILAENEEKLKLDNDITKYIFEVSEKLYERNGKKCYKISPKLEYMDHIEVLQAYYVAADGSKEAYKIDVYNHSQVSRL